MCKSIAREPFFAACPPAGFAVRRHSNFGHTMLATMRLWVARVQQRHALFEIASGDDQHQLKDIGVSREEALREATKPFWKR